ncbi:MAG: HAMP domain-containing protein [Desulfuromonadales bacterium]|nr:MAG: HAMP domain-containing protein [Desulfuromonadales bacterium]
MFFRSIRFSLTLWYAVTLAVILVLFSSFIFLILRNQLTKDFDRELLTVAEAVASPTLEPFRRAGPSVFDQVLEDFIGTRLSGKYVQVMDGSGRVTASSKSVEELRIPYGSSASRRAAEGKVTYETKVNLGLYPVRTITYPMMDGGRLAQVVQVGTSLKGVAETLEKVILVFAVSIPLSLLLWSVGGWFLAGRALKPVDLITRSARKITAENLSHRLEVANPQDEIGRLAQTFNDTLERLENAFTRVRRFSADVSHELRTPLTILRGETEVGLRWAREPDEFRELFRSNLEEINRMSQIIEALLELSRAEEGGLRLELAELDLDGHLAELVQQSRLIEPEKGLRITFTAHEPVAIRGDWLRLRQVFMNLLDNAVKYTSAGGEVSVVLDSCNGYARVMVVDSGSGIPSDDLSHIFERFYRVDKARNRADGGCGLGLSLARLFTEAHGGRIEVVSEVGKGSVFTVYLPLHTSA